jgi:hypothetical protein
VAVAASASLYARTLTKLVPSMDEGNSHDDDEGNFQQQEPSRDSLKREPMLRLKARERVAACHNLR